MRTHEILRSPYKRPRIIYDNPLLSTIPHTHTAQAFTRPIRQSSLAGISRDMDRHGPTSIGEFFGETKVRQDRVPVLVEEHVFRLEISDDDAVPVAAPSELEAERLQPTPILATHRSSRPCTKSAV